MRISFEMLPKKKLLYLFDLAAKTHKDSLAAQVVKELAKKNHLTINDQLRKLGQQANERKCVASFQMVSELWKKRL